VDRWEGTESWVEEGEEMKVMMGAGGGSRKAVKLVQMRQNKKGVACKCQGGGSGGGVGRGKGTVLVVVFIIIISRRVPLHLVPRFCSRVQTLFTPYSDT
jgi:hypothetical protein